ncbi:MAG TPA: trypsin-like peptidase domain-containing protein, partial [Longimicrobiales bacterium]
MNKQNPRARRTVGGAGALVTAAVALAVLAGGADTVRAAPLFPNDTTPRARSAAPAPAPTPAMARLEDLSDAFADVAARIKPAVVYIRAKQAPRPLASRGQRRGRGNGMDQLPPEFRQFFRQFGMPDMPGSPDAPDAPRGGGYASGSGFIVSPDGYILTNDHVVDGASEVTVRLLDRREFRARVIGTDPTTDVALLKIDAGGRTAAPLGNSEAARVGEWVLAVGNPLGENLTFTVTQGIISAKGRALELPGRSARSIQDFIQTDAAINPGNSGGPLVNTRGEVIGINSAIESPTGYNAGYGFAIPINLVRGVMEQIRATGHVERGALGISVREATAEDAAYVGLSGIRGVVVQDYATPDAPARRAGLVPGDVIVSVDGRPVEYVAQLQEAVAFHRAGDVVTLEVARKGGARVTVRVPVQRTPDERADARAALQPEAPRAERGASL